MAWYNVIHTCGHDERVQLYGAGKERNRRIEYMEQGLCIDCYRAQQRERAEQQTAGLDIPTLTGTDKQLGWATTLRAERLKQIAEWRSYLASHAQTDTPDPARNAHNQALLDTILAILRRIEQEPSAHRWIGHRQDSLREIVREVATVAETTIISDAILQHLQGGG